VANRNGENLKNIKLTLLTQSDRIKVLFNTYDYSTLSLFFFLRELYARKMIIDIGMPTKAVSSIFPGEKSGIKK
jgi:hypothetical protein